MGRHPDGLAKDYHVTHLWESQHEVLRLLVIGRKPKEISAIVGLSEVQISKIRNSPIAQDQLAILGVGRDVEAVKTSKIIAEVQPKAAQLLTDVIDGRIDANLGQRIGAAQDMLSRGGNSPVQRIRKDVQHGLTREALDALKARATEARELRDASYADVEIVED